MRRERRGQRVRAEDPPRPEELSGFRTIRFRRRLFWGLFLGWIPGGTFLSTTFGPTGPTAWMAAFLLAGMVLNLSRCPRCRQRCFIKGWVSSGPFDHRCSHCRVSLYWDRAHLDGRAGVSQIGGSKREDA